MARTPNSTETITSDDVGSLNAVLNPASAVEVPDDAENAPSGEQEGVSAPGIAPDAPTEGTRPEAAPEASAATTVDNSDAVSDITVDEVDAAISEASMEDDVNQPIPDYPQPPQDHTTGDVPEPRRIIPSGE